MRRGLRLLDTPGCSGRRNCGVYRFLGCRVTQISVREEQRAGRGSFDRADRPQSHAKAFKVAVSYGNSPRREPRDITTTNMCTDSAQSPNITSSRAAGHASAVGGLPSTALELAPGDITVARSAAQVPDGLDVDQMCFHITYAEPAARSPTVPRLPGRSLLDGPARIR